MATVKQKAKKVAKKPSSSKGDVNYSQEARDVLKRTRGDRAKATEHLKGLGCPSAAAIVSRVASNEGYPAVQKKSSPGKTSVKKSQKPVAKKSSMKKKKKPVEEYEEEDFQEEEEFEEGEELEDDDF